MIPSEIEIVLPRPHPKQLEIIQDKSKRKVVRAGRRSGKTVAASILAVREFLAGKRVLYGAPTTEQLERFWTEITRALAAPIQYKVFAKDETQHIVERRGTESRIRAKTCWDADSLRGDYADILILDEWQLMNEDTWEIVGAPMLLDNNGDAVFIYTPPSLRSAGVSKAHDPRHAAKMFKQAQSDTAGRWKAFSFTSHENPYISQEALSEITADMSQTSYRQEILAEDDEIQTSWLVYRAFKEATCKIPRFPIPNEWPIYVGHDFGLANPAALFIAQDVSTGYFYVWHEYLPGGGLSAWQHVEKFKEITAGYNVLKRVGGSHQEGEIRQAYTNLGWPIQEPRYRLVTEQLDHVIALMEANRLFIFNDCYNYLSELASCMWKLDDNQSPTNTIANEQNYHLCACARYILSDFSPRDVKSTIPVWRF